MSATTAQAQVECAIRLIHSVVGPRSINATRATTDHSIVVKFHLIEDARTAWLLMVELRDVLQGAALTHVRRDGRLLSLSFAGSCEHTRG